MMYKEKRNTEHSIHRYSHNNDFIPLIFLFFVFFWDDE